MTNVILFLLLLPAVLLGVEFLLCKKNQTAALIFPLVVACFFVLLGFYAVILAGILLGVFFVMRYLEKQKKAKMSELEKMHLEDL